MFINFLRKITLLPRRPLLHSNCTPYLSAVSHLSTPSTKSNNSSDSEIIITESCADRLKKIASDGVFLRITIDGGGCSGFQYRFDLDSKLQDDDVCFDRNGAKVVVDKISLDFLKGSTVDYKQELIRSSFVVSNNPQADSKCSCGSSFAAKVP